MENECNKIELVGMIMDDLEFSHSNNGEDFFSTRISVSRTSGVSDTLILSISGRTVVNLPVCANSVVFIKGQIRTFNYKKDNDDRISLKTYVLVDELEVLDEEIESEDDYYDENSVLLSGVLCKKGDLRATPFGRIICDCIIAVGRNYGKSDYIPCIFWGKNAKYIDAIDIGQTMEIYGRFQSRTYLKNGEEKVAYEISVSNLKLLEMKIG